MTLQSRFAVAYAAAVAVLTLLTPSRAWALQVSLTHEATELGQVTRLTATTDVDPALVEFRWTFGDGERTDFVAGLTEVEHTYAEPGHYAVNVLVRETAAPLLFQNAASVQTVYRPLTAGRPAHSTTIVYDESRARIYNVNPDNDSVGVVDASNLTQIAEIPVYGGPEALAIAPDGQLWVIHRKDHAVALIDLDTLQVTDGFRLPYGSQPVSVVMGPESGAAYIALMAAGKVLKMDTATRQVLGELAAPWARGLTVSHDESALYVTRWISSGQTGEVLVVDPQQMQPLTSIPLAIDPGPDTDQQGRGLPNYLFSASISPDGTEVWVTGKKDNIERGPQRDGEDLNQDNIVRPMVASIDTATGEENMAYRLDLDDRNLPTQVAFSPLGDYAFVVVTGSGFIDVRDMYGERKSQTDLKNAGKAPRGAVVGPEGLLFVHSFLTRSIVVFDVSQVLDSVEFAPPMIADIPVVANEKLSAEELRGKVVFYDSEDKRMAEEGYISCASCHFDGFEDGRVWDFTQRGEGLRNTTSLLGRRGMGHGRVHWTANFDEIQDFEHEIRLLFNGSGFIDVEGEDADAGVMNINPPLGEKLAGQSPELDDLAAYLKSLDKVNRSPFRNPDGTLTADGVAGRGLFCKLGCNFCHAGADFTDSSRGLLHDVGTIRESSGGRVGEALEGIDTPTLLGTWETAPYLHDGSAATIRDVLTTANVGDAHGFVSGLSEAELGQLEAYVLQIDHGEPSSQLPFEALPVDFVPDPACQQPKSPALPSPVAGNAEVPPAGTPAAGMEVEGVAPAAVGSVSPPPGESEPAGATPPPASSSPPLAASAAPAVQSPQGEASGGICAMASGSKRPGMGGAALIFGCLLLLGRRLGRQVSLVAAFGLLCGCSGGEDSETNSGGVEPPGLEPTPVLQPDLAPLATAQPALTSTPSVEPSASADLEGGPPVESPGVALPEVVDPVPELRGFLKREEQNDALCARSHQDSFFGRLCVEPRPTLTSLHDVIALLELDESRAFALTANSTSLVSHAVSPINPRLLIFPRVDAELTPPAELSIIGFVRGEQFVEVASRDELTGEPRFYLLRFEQPCNYDAGCDLTARLTEEVESNWTSYAVYDEDDLANTAFDCLGCHQTEGPGTRKFLRMQELRSPWMHWFPQRFVSRTESDAVLTPLFLEAHEMEQYYGGIPVQEIATTVDGGSAAHLEALMRAEGDADQPHVFAPRIEAEAKVDPALPTWQELFKLTLSGDAITVPYPFADVTDPDKRAAAVAAYRAVVSGAAPRESMPDIREVLSHDAEEKLGFFPTAGASGRQVLTQMCVRCHNGKSDPSLSRSRFNVLDWEGMTPQMKQEAMARIQTDDELLVMPPWRAGWLPPEAKQAALDALSQ